jgi:hypothetical protein
MSSQPQPRTFEEINQLISEWCADPYWALEDTEGFEFHREELASFAAEILSSRDDDWRKRLEAKVRELGIPGNMLLATYILKLEDRIARLESRLP